MTSTLIPPSPRRFRPLPVPLPWWERIPSHVATLTAALIALVTLAVVIPVPYAVRQPGPTVDTLGTTDDVPLISVAGAQTYPSEGELRLTTVSVSGGPGYPVGGLQVLRAWFDPRSSVVPREAIFPDEQSREEADQASQAQMTSSQENATAAALEALDYPVEATLTIAGVVDGGPSDGAAAEGDLLTSITVDGTTTSLTSFSHLADILAVTPPGSEVGLGLERDGEEVVASVTTGDDGDGGSLLGLLIDPEFDFPIDVEIQIHDIGGSSAGTMFALGIMESLTEGDQTGGNVIAGTGTMSLTGEVGAIGGIVQKMNGALRDGASYFLAPQANCDEVVGNEPDGLQVISVATLSEAWSAVEAIGDGNADGLPACTASS